jgi:hypothetical protein
MCDLSAATYREHRDWGDANVTLFANEVLGRTDLPRTLPELATLAVVEVDGDVGGPGPDPAILSSFRFVRTGRPGQGSLSDEPTNGLELVLISPREVVGEQVLRDWADFTHLRHIAEAAVPGFRMITPYVNVNEAGPRFLHFYEMHTDDPEGAFQDMTPRVADRLGGVDSFAYRNWAWHPLLRIDCVNTFRRIA